MYYTVYRHQVYNSLKQQRQRCELKEWLIVVVSSSMQKDDINHLKYQDYLSRKDGPTRY
jgi:hypothetical protein